jgi:putative FmdB family regulatory protein
MPLYLYKCDKCEQEFEVTQKFSDEPLTKCLDEACEGQVDKIIARSTFQLKGAGWTGNRLTKKD